MVLLKGWPGRPGGQVMCVEINGQHPALNGVLAPVEVLQRATQAQRR